MEADFSGYATKAGLKCSDGRTIMPDAFAHQDAMTVPLVWQHGHHTPDNVLGHAVLENRKDGVYAYGFFNNTEAGQSSKLLVEHGDITSLSIYANNLVEKKPNVMHGNIREVSLVLSGANPGAKIDYVRIAHSDGSIEEVDDEAIISMDVPLEHTGTEPDDEEEETVEVDNTEEETEATVEHAAEKTVQEIYDSLTDEQKQVVNFMIGAALDAANDDSLAQSDLEHADLGPDATAQDVFDTFTEQQKKVVYFMIGAALEDANSAEHSAMTHEEGNEMTRNVFEQNAATKSGPTLSHSQLEAIVEDAKKVGSFKESFLAHAAEYGIEDIDVLFPDAQSVTSNPEWISRRSEWVADVLNSTKHTPFARIKSTAADITADEARARGYVKGNKKKDEVIKLLKRVTSPKTIYKKQKLDRDDIVDITDLDIVAWLKAEMRLMLDEELARAILIGDGREPDDEDKIDEDSIRPIAYDDDMYSHKVDVASNVSGDEIIESVLRARSAYKGSGNPTLYTTDGVLTDLMLLKDKVGRRLYATEQELAAAMRVSRIVAVEVMESASDVLAIIVNLADYTVGADRGGNVSMFDDFDIDYNQYKYLIEARVSGALTRPKSAVVVRRAAGTVVTPANPTYNSSTHTITIPSTTGVDYKINDSVVTGNVVITEDTDVVAYPKSGYSFPHNTNSDWTYVY